MFLESNLFSLSPERLKKDLSMSCKYVLKKQDSGDRTIPVAEDVLGAESWNQANSDKQVDAYIWLVLIMTAAVKQHSTTKLTPIGRQISADNGKAKSVSWSDEWRVEMGAAPDSQANGGESYDWKDEIAMWRHSRASEGVKIE